MLSPNDEVSKNIEDAITILDDAISALRSVQFDDKGDYSTIFGVFIELNGIAKNSIIRANEALPDDLKNQFISLPKVNNKPSLKLVTSYSIGD